MGQRKNAENNLKTRKKHSKNTKTGQKSTEKCLLQEFFDAQKALCSKRFRDFGGMLKNLGKPQKISARLCKCNKKHVQNLSFQTCFLLKLAERKGFEPLCGLTRKLISSQPRYDHFDTSPYIQTSIAILLKLRKTEGYLRGMLR